jgi:arylsulfatase A-like enzyme
MSGDGKSLVPVLRDARVRVRTEVVAAYRGVQRSVRTERYKLIVYNVEGRRTVQLFDLQNDPLERNSVAEKEPARVAELTALLRRLLKEAGESEVWV